MPLLVLGFFVLQLDRSNISNALTDTLTKDLGISSDDVNLGNQLMLVGIIIFELPSNVLLQKAGAPVWLTAQMGIWGTIALTQASCTNIRSFYATRFLLGAFEGGYVPGGQYMLSLFYTKKELALRTAIFYFGNYFATATGSLIAAGVLELGGTSGLSGWQWLFISTLDRQHSRDPISLTRAPAVEGILTLATFASSSSSSQRAPPTQPPSTRSTTSSRPATAPSSPPASPPTTPPNPTPPPRSPGRTSAPPCSTPSPDCTSPSTSSASRPKAASSSTASPSSRRSASRVPRPARSTRSAPRYGRAFLAILLLYAGAVVVVVVAGA